MGSLPTHKRKEKWKDSTTADYVYSGWILEYQDPTPLECKMDHMVVSMD
jgi:hypothetical protein